MISRLKISLFQPSKIANFQRDSVLTTAIYNILLVILAIIPSIILIFSSVGLDYSDKTFIRDEIRGIEIPFQIVDYQLVKNTDKEEEYYKIEVSETITLVFTDLPASEAKYNELNIGMVVLFTKDSAIYQSSLFEIIEVNYKDHSELKNLDFSGATNNDSSFWDSVFPIINQVIKEHSPKNRVINTMLYFTMQLILLLITSLILAFFQRIRLASIMGFGKIWQLTTYAMTPFVIFTLFGELYNFTFLSTIGFVVSYIYANRMSLALLKK